MSCLVKVNLQGNYNIFTARYADDLTAAGAIDQLNKWCDELCRVDPKPGYYSEGIELCLVIRKYAEERTKSIFKHII